MAGAPKENTNAEKWTLEESTIFMNKALKLSINSNYDFIGEIARDLGTYRDVFSYLVDKFNELKPIHKTILSNLEANCFSHGKSGDIIPSLAIMNLKSNYKWTDRSETTIQGGDKPVQTIDYSKVSTEALKEIAEAEQKNEQNT